jgi:hypothetical protein
MSLNRRSVYYIGRLMCELPNIPIAGDDTFKERHRLYWKSLLQEMLEEAICQRNIHK